MKKEKSTMKTFAIVGIVITVIGLGLNLWNVYDHDPRLAINMLILLSNFTVLSTCLTGEK